MADTTIDRVQIEIEATAKGVSQVFNNLDSQVKSLKNALGGLNTKNITNVKQAVNTLNSTSASPKFNTAQVDKAAAQIEKDMNKVRDAIISANALAQSAFNGDSSSATSYERKAIAIQGQIDVLKSHLEQLGNVQVTTDAFSKIDSQIETARAHMTELVNEEARFVASGGSTKSQEYINLRAEIDSTRSTIDDLIDKQQEMLANGTATYNPYANLDAELQKLQDTLSNTKEQVQNINNTPVNPQVETSMVDQLKSSLSDIWSTITGISSKVSSFGSKAISQGFSAVSNTVGNLKSNLSSLSNTTSKFSGVLSTGFMKVLRYGFGIRSMYVLFRRLREAVKDSFTALQSSGAEFQTTRANIEALKTSLSTLKYQFGAAFEPIFNTIAPALQTLINYLISAMNTLSAFIAKITGRSTYSKVAAVTTKVASGAGSAAKAVGELNKQLQGFDELNNLDLDSGSGGSGGGGGSSSGGDVTYEEASVESALGDFANSLADMIKAGNWEGVGSAISEKITDALNGINWTTIKSKASAFGTNLANFLNGFINTDLFSSLGTTLAEALNTAFTSANSFAKTFDWVNLGTSIGTGITSFFTTADFGMWGETIHDWIGGILDAGIALLENTDFEEIGTKLGDFFEGIQVSDLMSKVKTLCSRIITAIGNTITGFKNNTDEKTKLTTAIGGLLGVLAITRSVPLTVTFAAVFGGLKIGDMVYESATGTTVNQSFIDEVEDIIDGLFGENKIEFDLLDFIQFTWSTLDTSTFAGKLYALLISSLTPAAILQSQGVDKLVWSWGDFITWDSNDWTAITTFFTNLGSFIGKQINSIWNGQTYSEAMVGANGMDSVAAQNTQYSTGIKQKAQELGKNIHDGIKKGFELQATVTVWTNPILLMYKAINEAFSTEFDSNSPAKKMYPMGENIFMGIVEGFKKAMTSYGWFGLLGDLYDYFNGNKTTTTKTGYSAKENFNNDDFRNKINVNINTKMTGQAKSKADVDNLKTSFSNLNTEASKGADATYKANVGGKIAEIADLDTWKQKFTSLYEKWQSKSATMRASVGGQMESIDDTDTWITKITDLATKWTNSKSTTSMNVTSDVGNLDGSGGYLDRLTKAANTWKNTNPTATFTTTLAGSVTSASGLDTVASSFSTLKSNFPSGSHTSSWSTTLSGATASEMGTYANAAKSIYDSFYTGTHTATWTMSVQGDTSNLDNFVNSIVNKLNDKLSKYRVTVANAMGGIINHGVRTSIPQYAGGTLNAGTMFIAGEAGPEIMGHINGRTEILNRSQLGSIIHSSFVASMAQFGNRMLATPESIKYNSSSYNGYNSSSGGDNGMLLSEQNALLREQNSLLREIAEKDMSISSRDVFNATRSEANSYYRRTGNSPFLS